MTTGECVRTLVGHTDTVISILFDELHNQLFSSSNDTSIKQWDLNTSICLKTIATNLDWHVFSFILIPRTNELLSASYDRKIHVWDLKTGKCARQFNVSLCNNIDMFLIKDTNEFVVLAQDSKTIQICELRTGHCLKRFKSHNYSIRGILMRPDSSQLITSSFDETFKVWDLSKCECVLTFNAYETDAIFIHMTLIPERNELVTGSQDETNIKIWNLQTGEYLKTIENCMFSFGQFLLVKFSKENISLQTK